MRVCPSCGARVDENANFCMECGWSLTERKKARPVRPILMLLFVIVFVPILCLAFLYSEGIIDLSQEWFQEEGETSHTFTLEINPDFECKHVETEVDGITYVQVGADGHKITLCDNPEATDVTWSELEEFLREDKTDEIPYSEETFVCADYAELLHNRAEVSGIRAAWVGVEFYHGDVGHALNAFSTTDKGLVFIDVVNGDVARCSSDKIATVIVGKRLTSELIFRCPRVSLKPMGVVEEITITW